MIHNDNLSLEGFDLSRRSILGIRSNISSLDILNRNVLHVESYIISWNSFRQLFVMHFNRLAISLNSDRGEEDGHSWLKDTGFNSSDRYSSDTSNFVHIL